MTKPYHKSNFPYSSEARKGFPSDENGETSTAYGEQELPYVRKIKLENVQIIDPLRGIKLFHL